MGRKRAVPDTSAAAGSSDAPVQFAKKRGRKASFGGAPPPGDRPAATDSPPFQAAVEECVNRWLEQWGSPSAALHALINTTAAKKQYAEKVNAVFPPEEHVAYLDGDNWTIGRNTILLWQACWDINAGNSGHVINDKFIKLIVLIMINGFESDPDIVPGIEMPVFDKPNPVWLPNANTGPVIPDFATRFHGVAFVKGWRRFMAANMMVRAIIETDNVDTYLAWISPTARASFSRCMGTYTGANQERVLDMSRGMTIR